MVEPALNMGTVRDIFKRSGKIPVSKDRLIICAKGKSTINIKRFLINSYFGTRDRELKEYKGLTKEHDRLVLMIQGTV